MGVTVTPAFNLRSDYTAAGDQPEAIRSLVQGYRAGQRFQTLLGVTGSGKTFTMANVVAELNRPTLVLSHNKTLVAQLYQEFRAYFPDNAVEYFVSYYDYYQPEAYLPVSDTYIEKDSSINEEIEKLRLRTTASLMSRRDVVVVSSVSCIYGLGRPDDYRALMVSLRVGQRKPRDAILRELVDIHYTRNDYELKRGTFRARGDVVEIRPAYDDYALRVELFGDEVERLERRDPITGGVLGAPREALVYPARHYVTREEQMDRVLAQMRAELEARLEEFRGAGKLVEAQRLESRTRYDMEMLAETGFCPGVENYSRIIEGREPGTPPSTLLDFFPRDFFLIVDESHVSIPQVRGMYGGDRSRKLNLVDYGFRLPCALDNRPLRIDEFEDRLPDTLFVSATPAEYELEKSGGVIVEQIVRPTGLLDPAVEVRPIRGQIDDLLEEIRKRLSKPVKERTLVLTLTQKSAEDLADFLQSAGLDVLYMHAETQTLKRTEILQSLRRGEIDVLVGINLLREGLDLPEVSLVAILDADKEGFLRNHRTLIQIMGRAARNVEGRVILYADRVTGSMRSAMDETTRRRFVQQEYNRAHGITPTSVVKEIRDGLRLVDDEPERPTPSLRPPQEALVEDPLVLEREMLTAAEALDFERAAELRDRLLTLKGRK